MSAVGAMSHTFYKRFTSKWHIFEMKNEKPTHGARVTVQLKTRDKLLGTVLYGCTVTDVRSKDLLWAIGWVIKRNKMFDSFLFSNATIIALADIFCVQFAADFCWCRLVFTSPPDHRPWPAKKWKHNSIFIAICPKEYIIFYFIGKNHVPPRTYVTLIAAAKLRMCRADQLAASRSINGSNNNLTKHSKLRCAASVVCSNCFYIRKFVWAITEIMCYYYR